METEREVTVDENALVVPQPSAVNIWAQIGRPDAEERFAKVQLAYQIRLISEERKLSIRKLAKLLETDHARLSDLLRRGRVEGYSLDRLISYLNKLDRSVEITIRVKPAKEVKAGITVKAEEEVKQPKRVAKAS